MKVKGGGHYLRAVNDGARTVIKCSDVLEVKHRYSTATKLTRRNFNVMNVLA